MLIFSTHTDFIKTISINIHSSKVTWQWKIPIFNRQYVYSISISLSLSIYIYINYIFKRSIFLLPCYFAKEVGFRFFSIFNHSYHQPIGFPKNFPLPHEARFLLLLHPGTDLSNAGRLASWIQLNSYNSYTLAFQRLLFSVFSRKKNIVLLRKFNLQSQGTV